MDRNRDLAKGLSRIENNTSLSIEPKGAILIDDVVEHAGPFFAITALEDAEVDVSFLSGLINFNLPFVNKRASALSA